ncbi:hypothetical protein Pcaca05_01250 [Pectobacterium carotovorum subsp. carotovorum]|nr:hypothetical protein Pcaca05_01250 [Pectobacterium carotovorum subsp. carotovorum]
MPKVTALRHRSVGFRQEVFNNAWHHSSHCGDINGRHNDPETENKKAPLFKARLGIFGKFSAYHPPWQGLKNSQQINGFDI